MTDDLLWPRYADPSDLAAIEAVPLAARGLPDSTYALLTRAATRWPDRTAITVPPGRRAVARAAAAQLRRAARRRAPLRQPAPPARRAARRRGRPDGTQLRRADHRDAGRPAGRDRRAAQRRPVPRAPRRAAPPLRRPGARRRRAGARARDVGRRARDLAGDGVLDAILVLRPTAADGPPPALPAVDGVLRRLPRRAGRRRRTRRPSTASRPRAADLAGLFHTGGTTGAPKLAAHTHANEVADAWMLAANSLLEPDSAVFAALPLFHVNALVVTLLAPLFKGQRVVWAGPLGYRDPALFSEFWKIVEHYRIAAMSAVPTVYATLANSPVDADISSLRVADGGRLAAAGRGPGRLPGPHRRAPARRLRPDRGDLRQRPQLPGRPTARLGRAATALPARQGGASPPGRDLAGPARRARPGSWRSAARRCSPATSPGAANTATSWTASASSSTAGWTPATSAGVDDDGFVYLTGRAKDLIIRGGHNIDPAIIEDALLAHPAGQRRRRRRPTGRPRRRGARRLRHPRPRRHGDRGGAARLGERAGRRTRRRAQAGHGPRRTARSPTWASPTSSRSARTPRAAPSPTPSPGSPADIARHHGDRGRHRRHDRHRRSGTTSPPSGRP